MEIKREFRNELLGRKEMRLVLNSDSNPGFQEAIKHVVKKLNVEEDRIVINNVINRFGSSSFLIDFFVYDSVSHKNKIEPKKKLNKEAKVAA